MQQESTNLERSRSADDVAHDRYIHTSRDLHPSRGGPADLSSNYLHPYHTEKHKVWSSPTSPTNTSTVLPVLPLAVLPPDPRHPMMGLPPHPASPQRMRGLATSDLHVDFDRPSHPHLHTDHPHRAALSAERSYIHGMNKPVVMSTSSSPHPHLTRVIYPPGTGGDFSDGGSVNSGASQNWSDGEVPDDLSDSESDNEWEDCEVSQV